MEFKKELNAPWVRLQIIELMKKEGSSIRKVCRDTRLSFLTVKKVLDASEKIRTDTLLKLYKYIKSKEKKLE